MFRGVGIPAILLILFLRHLNPADFVKLTIESVPSNTSSAFVVSEQDGELGLLSWYDPQSLAGVNERTADLENRLERDGCGSGTQTFDVQWRGADRYGVLIRRQDDSWRFWWLAASAVRRPSLGRYLSLNGEMAEMTLPPVGQSEIPGMPSLGRLGYPDAEHRAYLQRTEQSIRPARPER